ncbi:hypothetical protein HDU79_009279 [Rhizoclosmatium sp. JEL0117]|nr:hypothetical protein HDU79_009279 [Rhizoclosmatium sp. JEL0117]
MDFYEVLHVERNASSETIHDSYIKLSSKTPTEKRSLTTAYLVLSRDRLKYDEQGGNYKVPDEITNADPSEVVKHPIITKTYGTYAASATVYGMGVGFVVGGPVGAAVGGTAVGTAVGILEYFSLVSRR